MVRMLTFDESYHGKLLNAVGGMEIIVPSARAVLIDKKERVLLIKSKDNSKMQSSLKEFPLQNLSVSSLFIHETLCIFLASGLRVFSA